MSDRRVEVYTTYGCIPDFDTWCQAQLGKTYRRWSDCDHIIRETPGRQVTLSIVCDSVEEAMMVKLAWGGR